MLKKLSKISAESMTISGSKRLKNLKLRVVIKKKAKMIKLVKMAKMKKVQMGFRNRIVSRKLLVR